MRLFLERSVSVSVTCSWTICFFVLQLNPSCRRKASRLTALCEVCRTHNVPVQRLLSSKGPNADVIVGPYKQARRVSGCRVLFAGANRKDPFVFSRCHKVASPVAASSKVQGSCALERYLVHFSHMAASRCPRSKSRSQPTPGVSWVAIVAIIMHESCFIS